MGKEEILWLNNNTLFKNGVAIRGGMPPYWSQFGPATQQSLPVYGFIHSLPWTLKSHHKDVGDAVLTFELTQSEKMRESWPHDFVLLVRLHVGKTCEIDLKACGEFETTSALYAYFNMDDIAKVSVSGLGGRLIGKVSNTKKNILTSGIQTFPNCTDHVHLSP